MRIVVLSGDSGHGGQSNIREHMPTSHRRYGDWTIKRIRKEAAREGTTTTALCELIVGPYVRLCG